MFNEALRYHASFSIEPERYGCRSRDSVSHRAVGHRNLGFENVYKVNGDENLGPASCNVVLDSRGCMQTVPPAPVDANVAHDRSMPLQYTNNRQTGRGRGWAGARIRGGGAQTADCSDTVTNEGGVDGRLPKKSEERGGSGNGSIKGQDDDSDE